MKNLFLGLIAFAWLSPPAYAQSSSDDTIALMIVNHMADVIGDLTSCSFTLATKYDAVDPDIGLNSHYSVAEVYFDGPDKMQIHIKGDKGHRGFWYNGITLAYYSFDENNFAIIDAPPTTIETIDTVHKAYGIDFPAADFFYPTFTDDLVSQSDRIIYNGMKMVEGQECFQIIASNDSVSFQFWIANDATNYR